MIDLLRTYSALARAINADPVLCLAHAAAWLDPLRSDDDDIDMPQCEDDTLYIALHITRRAFPDIYFDALQAMRRGATYQKLDTLICEAVQAEGIPLENLEMIGWGIPLPAYGVVLDDPEFYTSHPDVIPVLEYFGISPEPNPHNITIPDVIHKAADCIADDLLEQDDERWRQVGWLLKWLFSCSGNSSVDYDYELMCEFEPLSWEKDDIAFAIDIIEEANSIMSDALSGLEWITAQPDLLTVLQDNVRHVYKAIKHQNGKRDKLNVPLKWHKSDRLPPPFPMREH